MIHNVYIYLPANRDSVLHEWLTIFRLKKPYTCVPQFLRLPKAIHTCFFRIAHFCFVKSIAGSGNREAAPAGDASTNLVAMHDGDHGPVLPSYMDFY